MATAKKVSAKEKMSISRTNIILNFGFFSSLLVHLNVRLGNEELEAIGMPTMATDGEEIIYHEKFVEQHTIPQLNFVVIHEILHVALAHMWRRNHRQPELWNMACDFVVNNAIHEVISAYQRNANKREIRENEKVEMPKEVLYDESFANMSAEEVYAYLEKNAKKQSSSSQGKSYSMGQSSGSGKNSNNNQKGNQKSNASGSGNDKNNNQNGSGDGDDDSQNGNKNGNDESGTYKVNGKTYKAPSNHKLWDKADKLDQSTKNEKQMEWGSNLMQAAEDLKRRGIDPGSLKLHINELTKPQKNWKALLRDFIEEEINDYSFAPPDRRYDFDGIMLPDFNDKQESVKDLLFFVDTSGSMSAEEITVCYSEIQGAINQFKKRLHGILHFFDYDVKKKTYNFDDVYGDISKIMPVGGGGTSFEAVFKYVNANRKKYNDVKGIIIMTDGECPYPPESITKGTPVLWIFTTKGNEPPFGRHTQIKV